MLSTVIAAAVGQSTIPVFLAESPGPLVPASRAAKPSLIDKTITSGLIEVDQQDALLNSATPKDREGAHHLPFFNSKSGGKILIGLPFATEERFRNVKLWLKGKEYAVRLPLSTALGSSKRKPGKAKIGPILSVETSFDPWRFTSEGLRASFQVTPRSRSHRLVSYGMTSSKSVGRPRQITTELQEGASGIKFFVNRSDASNTLFVEIQELTPVRIKVKVKRLADNTPEYFLLSGQKIYSANRRMVKESGFVAIKVRNIYLSDYNIHRRPAGSMAGPSYASIKDGEVIETVGYRAAGKPNATRIKMDLPKVSNPAYQHFFSAITISPYRP